MNEALPHVTVVIAARPGQEPVLSREAALRLDYPADRLEILVARGAHPSAQRNLAVREARGDIVYFLDDDSVPRPGNLRAGVAHFAASARVAMVGGPNLCPTGAPALERLFAAVMASWLAFGPSRARYAAIGAVRDSSEKELILCNLMARRRVLLELGGFDESLYPNEENALMDRVQAAGGILLHDPALVVERRPRRTLRAFARMLFTYGRGRAEQFRVHPTFGSVLNFVPPLFVVYLAGVPFLPWVWRLPLALYGVAVMVQGWASGRHLVERLGVMPLLVVAHTLYGLGFWRGLFTRLGRRAGPGAGQIALERAVPA